MTTIAHITPAVKSNPVHQFAAGLYSNRHGLRAPVGGCTVNGRVFKGGQFCLPYDVANPHGEAEVKPVVLAVHGFRYVIEGIKAAPEIGTHAFSMHKVETNHHYFVILDNFGEVLCDCPSFNFRHAGTGVPCKHGRALIEAGHIPAPKRSTRRRIDQAHTAPPAPRRRRFEPSPEDMRNASLMFNA